MKNNIIKTLMAHNEKTKQEFGSLHLQHENVYVEPHTAHQGDNLSINYQGLLRNSGAKSVYLHYGFDQWQSPQTLLMNRTDDGVFRSEIRASGSREVNFCFKDCANNWDNNNGCNWNVQIQ